MPIVLVVDDSPMDRRLIGSLLREEQEADWVVDYAANGVEALAKMEDLVPDAVVTDLLMPQMDGLKLVAAVRDRYPQVPVILITGQGSESLAVDALEQGAASYVPKRQIADKLLHTVKQVLAVARANRSYQKLTECFVRTQFTLQLDNDPALIPPLVELFQQMLSNLKICDAAARVHVGIALEEGLLNAMYHGNLAVSPEQMQQARSELSRDNTPSFIQERRSQSPYRDRRVFIDAQFGPKEARFVIRDQGRGFDVAGIPGRGDPKTLERAGGRGLVLMRNFMDEVTFNGVGNEVTMVKKRTNSAVSEG